MKKEVINEIAKTLEHLAQLFKEMVADQTKDDEIAGKDSTVRPSITAEEVDVTIEDIRAVLAEKSQDGLTVKVKELLTSFGADKLSAVKIEDYPKLFMAAKKLK